MTDFRVSCQAQVRFDGDAPAAVNTAVGRSAKDASKRDQTATPQRLQPTPPSCGRSSAAATNACRESRRRSASPLCASSLQHHAFRAAFSPSLSTGGNACSTVAFDQHAPLRESMRRNSAQRVPGNLGHGAGHFPRRSVGADYREGEPGSRSAGDASLSSMFEGH